MRFADIDGLGHVNNARIQEYYDIAKTDFYTGIFGDTVRILPDRIAPVIVSNRTDYMAQTRLYEKVAVETSVEKIGTKSMTLFLRLIGGNGEIKSECRSVLVAFDFSRQESVEISDEWRAALEEYLQ